MAAIGTGVVIGSHSLKVVQARKKGPVLKLTRVANVKLDAKWSDRPFDGPKQEYIQSLLTGLGLKPGDAMVGLTGRDLIIRYTHVPPVPDWRLDMLMKFEIEEVSEQSGGEVCADWARLDLPEAVSGDNTILVSLAKNAALLPRIDMLTKAGLKLRGGCPNSIAMSHAFTSAAKIQEGEATLLMHIGAENTDIAIQKDGRLLFARNVSGGGRLFSEAIMTQFNVNLDRAEKMKMQKADVTPKSSVSYADSLAEKVSNAVIGVTGQFVSMVHSSVMFCKAQTKIKDLSVSRVILTGGGANLTGLSDYLATNLGMPVEVFDPSGAADLSGLEPDDAEVLEKDGAGLAVALGLASLALDRQAFRVEILPEEHRKKRRFAEREVFMVGAGVLMAVLIAILFYTSSRDQDAALTEYKSLQTKSTQFNQLITANEDARIEYEKERAKWIRLRDHARAGPSLQRALAMFSRIVLEHDFKEIHGRHVSTETTLESPPAKKEDQDLGSPLRMEEESVQHMHITVKFIADIQALGRPAGQVYADFIQALRAEVRTMPDVELRERPLQQKKYFEFRLKFSPPEAIDPPAEEDDAEVEGN